MIDKFLIHINWIIDPFIQFYSLKYQASVSLNFQEWIRTNFLIVK